MIGDESKLDFEMDDQVNVEDGSPVEDNVKPWIDSSQMIEQEQQQPAYDDNGYPVDGDYVEAEDPNDKDVVQAYLESKGVDTQSIKFQDPYTGLLSERNWNDLTAEEQYNILSDAHKNPAIELSDQEKFLINNIREKNISPAQYLDQYAQAVMNSQPTMPAKPLQGGLSRLDDDSVFIADLMTRVPDITDEEATAALDSAKENPSVFERQVASIRNQFAANEAMQDAQNQAAIQQVQDQRLAVYQNEVLNSINNFNGVGNLEVALTQGDAENIAQFILGHNELGASGLGQALQDPNNLVKASWFLLNQENIFNDIQNYVQQATMAARQEGYNIGRQEGQRDAPPRVVRQRIPPKNASTPIGQPTNMTIDDLDYQF